MLQWNPRLIALLVLALTIAAFVGEGTARGFKWV
jgi:hypothetical protein